MNDDRNLDLAVRPLARYTVASRRFRTITNVLLLAAAIASIGVATSVIARDVQLFVFQIGSATGDDERQAKADAYDQAVMALNSTCFGEIDRVAKTAENCIRSDDQFTCVTSVKAMCTIRRR